MSSGNASASAPWALLLLFALSPTALAEDLDKKGEKESEGELETAEKGAEPGPDPELVREFELRKRMTLGSARSWYTLGRWAQKKGLKSEAADCFSKVLEFDTDHIRARRELGQKQLDDRWVSEEEYYEARPEERPGAPPGEVEAPPLPPGERLDRAARQARLERLAKKGRWKVAHASARYDFLSNGSVAEVERLGRAMDLMCEEYKKIFAFEGEIGRPFPIHLYATKKEFMKRTGSPADKGGFWDGKKIVAFHERFGDLDTQAVLFHEGTHQFQGLALGEHMPKVKPWLIEGMAVYFEASRVRGGKLETGIVPPWRLTRIKQAIHAGTNPSLGQLLHMGEARFGALHYAQSWSLIHFLINTKGGKRQFARYWKKLRDGRRDQSRLFKQLFSRPMHEIEVAWQKYVLALK